MKLVSFVIFLALVIPTSAQTFSLVSRSKIVIMQSEDVQGQLSAKRLNACLTRLVREWNLKYESLPRIFVFHVSEETAAAALILEKLAVRENRSDRNGDFYYEVWMVGTPNINADMVAFQNILEDYFHLEVTSEKRDQIMARVARFQNATTDAYEGR